MTILTMVSGLAYLGLAVLGWGGFGPFFSHPPLVALTVAACVMFAIAPLSGGNISAGEREDRSNRWVLPVFGMLGLLSAWLPAYTDRRDFLTLDGDGVRWLGVALYVVGGILRLWPVFVLGRRFSGLVAIQPGHTLVTAGIYSKIRNPSYLGMMVLSVGWALAFRSLVGVALALLTLVPLIARIRAEERLLRSQFGHEYEAYCARTWRLVPGVY
ncbi:MAG: isoprenylcysteine carboxylmethyltransferase family protein [Alphaproteobacteria bacterium]|nr:isoprenylcysteine carboxylmethyltransferase family protein [Alphaproteobacteria bacterium]